MLLHPRFYDGFRDGLAGLPFDHRTLDGWPMLDQHRYENGRALAAECRSLGLTIRWPDRTRIPRALKRLAVMRAAGADHEPGFSASVNARVL